MRVADYIAKRCVDSGAKHVFLVTGGGAMHLNDAFARNPKLAIVCFHHEQAAAMAAEAYFRYSGQFAVLNVTTGPGGINALNGVFGAYVDSQSIVVVSGQVKRETYSGSYDLPIRQLGDQEVDILALARHLVKYESLLSDPNEVGLVMDKALYLTISGRPGPVWIDVPIDVQSAEIEEAQLASWDRQPKVLIEDRDVTPNSRAEIEATLVNSLETGAVGRIARRLMASKRPVFLLGNGVRLSGVCPLILAFAERYEIPVVTGWNAHDLVPNSHPCFAGRPGTVGDRAGNFTVQGADFLLILGCRLNIRQISYNFKSFAKNAWRVMVDVDPIELKKPTLTLDEALCADLREFWPKFQSSVEATHGMPTFSTFLTRCKERVDRYPCVLAEYRDVSGPLNPYFFIERLFELLPEDAAIVAGNGSACVIGFQAAQIKKGQRFFTNSGSASMGYDLPAAIGVSFARQKQPVYCLAGDGSLMMNIQELQTLVEYKLPVKVLVLNNGGYLSIRQTQQAYFPDNMIGSGPGSGVSMPNFLAVGLAFGLNTYQVTSIGDLESEAFTRLMFNSEPVIVDVQLDPEQGFSPKLTSRKLSDGTMMSPELDDMFPFLPREEMLLNREA